MKPQNQSFHSSLYVLALFYQRQTVTLLSENFSLKQSEELASTPASLIKSLFSIINHPGGS
jgi:hypothetical protein